MNMDKKYMEWAKRQVDRGRPLPPPPQGVSDETLKEAREYASAAQPIERAKTMDGFEALSEAWDAMTEEEKLMFGCRISMHIHEHEHRYTPSECYRAVNSLLSLPRTKEKTHE